MKPKAKKQATHDADKRPSYNTTSFWMLPGEDMPTAMRRAWMKPSELAAWRAAKTETKRNSIERSALAAMVKERDAAAAERKQKIAEDMALAEKERQRRAERICQLEEATIRAPSVIEELKKRLNTRD